MGNIKHCSATFMQRRKSITLLFFLVAPGPFARAGAVCFLASGLIPAAATVRCESRAVSQRDCLIVKRGHFHRLQVHRRCLRTESAGRQRAREPDLESRTLYRWRLEVCGVRNASRTVLRPLGETGGCLLTCDIQCELWSRSMMGILC